MVCYHRTQSWHLNIFGRPFGVVRGLAIWAEADPDASHIFLSDDAQHPCRGKQHLGLAGDD